MWWNIFKLKQDNIFIDERKKILKSDNTLQGPE